MSETGQSKHLSLHHFCLLTSQKSLSQVLTSGDTDVVDPESDGK